MTRRQFVGGGASAPRTSDVNSVTSDMLMDGIATRHSRHPEITEHDYAGARTILDNRYKLEVAAGAEEELFDLRADLGEKTNLIDSNPDVAALQQ